MAPPSDFRESQSMFEQLVAASSAPAPARDPEPAPAARAYDPTGNGNHRSHE